MRVLFLIVIGLAIPFLSPILFKYYIAYVPGFMDGTEDGWLSYLGGYSGGFLAFISAYVLFSKQRTLSDRCWFIWSVAGNTKDIESNTQISIVYTKSKDIDDFDKENRNVLSWGDYGVAVVSIKNVSANHAKYVDIKLVQGLFTIKPFCHRKGSPYISKFSHVTELEPSERMDFVLHIEPCLLKVKKCMKFKVVSESLKNVRTVQYLKLFYTGSSFELIN
ncbi:TPA: hypothetical protein ACGFXY_003674 [Vibrio cholerae]|uniref:Uncharacterized protein n=1 Tax=Salinivibrio kushneri TaxID=1908198 RepID=A0AA47KNZ9_9GAMM|nr:hypothetical protein [Salinivibrio kushneri]WBA10342.1 hypothetical protein N8M53_13370 [Salinivibrio kushneri]